MSLGIILSVGGKMIKYPFDPNLNEQCEALNILPDEDEPIYIRCPKCSAEYEDFDGVGVLLFCEECKYCVHASITDGYCDYCQRKEEDILSGE